MPTLITEDVLNGENASVVEESHIGTVLLGHIREYYNTDVVIDPPKQPKNKRFVIQETSSTESDYNGRRL